MTAEEDRREVPYAVLLALLLLRVGGEGLFDSVEYARWLGLLSLIGGLVLTAWVTADRAPTRFLLGSLGALATGAVIVGEASVDPNAYDGGAFVVAFLLLTGVAAVILRDVLRMPRVSAQVVSGGVAVYLLVGIAFSMVFAGMERLEPGSFVYSGGPLPHTWPTYFSFVTLTTLGFGDIAPATAPARSLVVLEAIVGQLYLTVLIGRLVGLQLAHGQSAARE